MLPFPITYTKVANAVNKCGKAPQFASLITLLGGTNHITLVIFTIFQVSGMEIDQDKQYWIKKNKSSLQLASVSKAK
jgi:hypothetical protein